MRKVFLLNPVEFTRISDGFSPSRRHPILNTIRAHKGTDYAAPKGTEVVATADGNVTFVGRNGSFGKLVVIQHGERFVTKYAHLNGYARGLKVGTKVRQNDVIGYVGQTGSATGPHLHYEFLMDGVHRNSQTILDQLPRAESIAAAEMPRFREQTGILATLLAAQGNPAAALTRNTVSNLQE
jgi:murein DD-endopeptidase MepM/ murein hydrolase activator NlpD